MSSEFIRNKTGSGQISIARRQQKQLKYLTQSSIQEDITGDYFSAWANSQYATNDFFLNWLKTCLRQKNFLSVFKFLRYPLSSAKLINDEIKPQLRRVFYSEDAYSKYVIKGKDQTEPELLHGSDFNEQIFDALLFNSNDVVVCDLNDVNTPYRTIVPIENIIAIKSHNGKIKEIAYTAEITLPSGEKKCGYAYINDEQYAFYEKESDDLPILVEPHDLGECPADYISDEAWDMESDAIRKNIFSYVRADLEEYVFLKALQRMTDVNGTIPVITKLKTAEVSKEGRTADASNNEPMSAAALPKQSVKNIGNDFPGSESPMQAGTIYNVPQYKNTQTGEINMDVVKNFINHFYTPVECLKFLNERLLEVRVRIVSTILGDFDESSSSAKNEMQVSKSYVNKQDKLRHISKALSKLRTNSDRKMLGLKYGAGSVYCDYFFGSDFFLETQQDLFLLFKDAPNVIERKNILVKQSQNRNRFNPERAKKDALKYELLPYASDKDFDTAIAQRLVSPENKILQTQFNYYIGLFEAQYGDLLEFYNALESSDSEKLIAIRGILIDLIKPELNKITANAIE